MASSGRRCARHATRLYCDSFRRLPCLHCQPRSTKRGRCKREMLHKLDKSDTISYDLPESWWDQEGVPVEAVIGKGLGKDEKVSQTPEVPESVRPYYESINREMAKLYPDLTPEQVRLVVAGYAIGQVEKMRKRD